MKNVIVSSIGTNSKGEYYDDWETIVLEFGISLRYLAKYNGEVAILDYGMPNKLKTKLKKMDFRIIECLQRGKPSMIASARMVDLDNVLKKYYPDYNICSTDIDVWFQDEVDFVFNRINNKETGLLYATCIDEFEERRLNKRGPANKIERIRIMAQYKLLIRKFGGTIQGGFFAGKFNPVINKLKAIKSMYANMYEIPKYGTDQFFVNMLYDFTVDESDGNKMTTTPRDFFINDNVICIKQNDIIEKLSGVHVMSGAYVDNGEVKYFRNNEDIRFYHKYAELFHKYNK